MGDNEEVRIQTTEAGEGAIPMKSDRPEWLPEKFESAEELAKSYGELEKKLGDTNTEETPAEENEVSPVAPVAGTDWAEGEWAGEKTTAAADWDEEQGGKMTLLRLGTGNYTCIATGFSSLRLGKPLEPIPGPLCADENAWAFFKAVMNEKNPMKPAKPYPTTPGMAWMLAGMGVNGGMVDVGSDEKIEILESGSGSKMTKITPHVMILPLPIAKSGNLSTKYDPAHPLTSWIMAANSPIEHLMIHVSDEDAEAIKKGNN